MMMCLNQQRIVIYNYRRDALEGEDHIYELVRDFIITIVQDIIAYQCSNKNINARTSYTKYYEALEYMTGLSHKDFDECRY